MRRPSSFLHLAALCALLLGTRTASADDDKRPPMDYGSPKPKTDAGDVLAWPARVVLFPLFLVNEFILRRPLGALVRAAESGQWIEKVTDFFTFGPRKQVVIFPSALFDFGLLPSVGFNATWKYFLAEPNTLALHFGTWGPNWIVVRGTDTYDLDKKNKLTMTGSYWRRQDNPFYGMGPLSRQDDRVRFAAATYDAAPGYRHEFGSSSVFETSFGMRGLKFYEGACCEDQSLQNAIIAGKFQAPPGYGRGFIGVAQHAALALDSREERPAPGSGVRLEVHEDMVFPLDPIAGEPRRSWIRYGGEVGAAIDLTGKQRVLSLTLNAELVDKLSPGDIPFTEQVTLGGDKLMRGYLRNRLIGQSAAVATIQYTWPVWVFLDGVAAVSAGNVFGTHFEGFDAGLARLSANVGVRSNGDRDSGFEATFGVGTEPIDQNFKVNSFRILIGSHHGF